MKVIIPRSDLIKETYELFTKYLGEDTPRGKKLDPIWDAFRNDVLSLLEYARDSGVLGAESGLLDVIENNHAEFLSMIKGNRWEIIKKGLPNTEPRGKEDVKS